MPTSTLPFFSADVLKKMRAVIALHIKLRKKEETETDVIAPVSGGRMENGLPTGSNVGKVKAKLPSDESVSSSGSREGNVGNDALHVIGLHGLGDKISLFLKELGAGRSGFELPHGSGHAVRGNA